MVQAVEDDDAEVDDVGGRARWLIALLGLMLRRPQDTLAAMVASTALVAILVNALFLQPNPHPAPLFSVKPKPRAAATLDPTGTVAVLPRPRPADLGPARAEPAAKPAPAARTRTDIVTDIQRELARRGFYDGAVDGIHGSRTDAAMRALERATGTSFGAEPSEAALQAILRAPAAGRPGALRRADPIGELVARTAPQNATASAEPGSVAIPVTPIASSARFEPGQAPGRPEPGDAPSRPGPNAAAMRPEPMRPEPMRPEPGSAPDRSQGAARPTQQAPGMAAAPAGAELAATAEPPTPRADLPSPRVKAVQRALSEFGYGQLKPTGIVDSATAAAIRDFEEARNLLITGQMSERMVQELVTVTGHAIE